MPVPADKNAKFNDKITPEVYSLLLEMVRDMKFGTVTLIFQDGKVIQIERNEKKRIV